MKKSPTWLFLLCFGVAGCSLFGAETQTVKIACSEPDAVLDVNGMKYRGNAELQARRNKDLEISCSKPGFLTVEKRVKTSLSGTGIADAMGALLIAVPAVGLVKPGAWDLDETDIRLPMVPEK